MEGIVTRLKDYMEQREWTIAEFATALSVNRATLTHILSGRNKPNLAVAIALANCDPELDLRWFLTGEETKKEAALPQLDSQPEIVVKEVPAKTGVQQQVVEKIVILKPDGTYSTFTEE